MVEGVACLVPEETQLSDLVCQFIGSLVPFILKPISSKAYRPDDGGRKWPGSCPRNIDNELLADNGSIEFE